MLTNILTSFIAGVVCGLCFAPIYFFPGVFSTAILIAQIKMSRSRFEAMKYSYGFGFGFYLSSLYWISFALTIFIDEFGWAIPFALLGLPAFLAIFTASIGLISWHTRNSMFFHFYFCCVWVFIEWVMSWIFTGLPWALIGYGASVWIVLLQSASVIGIFGLSFLVIYVASSPYQFFLKNIRKEKENFHVRLIVSLILLVAIIIYGIVRLNNNPIEYKSTLIRIVQPSIEQQAKWEPEIFWKNLDQHIELSQREGNPDLIIWSEAALTVPHHLSQVRDAISTIFSNEGQILLTGGVSDNDKAGDELELYTSLIGINSFAAKILEYHKSHLVPFGEYIPFKNILPIKKITAGMIDYTAGKRETKYIEKLNLTFLPLICYEAIFPEEVRVSNNNIDVIINITNDSWYGKSSGPYQHFEITKLRAIENGLPVIRTANNGISGVIDSLGRVLEQSKLNEVTIIDTLIPNKLSHETLFSKFGLWMVLLNIILVLLLQLIIRFFKSY